MVCSASTACRHRCRLIAASRSGCRTRRWPIAIAAGARRSSSHRVKHPRLAAPFLPCASCHDLGPRWSCVRTGSSPHLSNLCWGQARPQHADVCSEHIAEAMTRPDIINAATDSHRGGSAGGLPVRRNSPRLRADRAGVRTRVPLEPGSGRSHLLFLRPTHTAGLVDNSTTSGQSMARRPFVKDWPRLRGLARCVSPLSRSSLRSRTRFSAAAGRCRQQSRRPDAHTAASGDRGVEPSAKAGFSAP